MSEEGNCGGGGLGPLYTVSVRFGQRSFLDSIRFSIQFLRKGRYRSYHKVFFEVVSMAYTILDSGFHIRLRFVLVRHTIPSWGTGSLCVVAEPRGVLFPDELGVKRGGP